MTRLMSDSWSLEPVGKRSAVAFFVYAGQVSFFPVFFVNQSGHRPTIVGDQHPRVTSTNW
jgi:hypothetical protein